MTRLRPDCGVARISARAPILACADLERARGALLRRRARRQTVSTASTRAARMLRPGPAVPIERPPTLEEVIDELRPRLTPERARAWPPSSPQVERFGRAAARLGAEDGHEQSLAAFSQSA